MELGGQPVETHIVLQLAKKLRPWFEGDDGRYARDADRTRIGADIGADIDEHAGVPSPAFGEKSRQIAIVEAIDGDVIANQIVEIDRKACAEIPAGEVLPAAIGLHAPYPFQGGRSPFGYERLLAH